MNFAGARRRAAASIVVAAAAAAAFALPAFAASDQPVRVILPVSAGSGVDTIVRAVGPSLGKALGQPLTIENQPGAGGLIGTAAIVKAPPDGQTIGFVSNDHVVNPSVYRNMPFDALADITPICVVGATPFVLVVNASKVPAKNAKELQAFLKARPGVYNYASSGNGTVIHLAGAMFVDAAGVDVHHIAYKGVAPMLAALVAGQVEMGVLALPAVQGQLKGGALRAIGIMGKVRAPALPDLPTLAEQGFAQIDMAGWFAAIGPAQMPPDEVRRLHDAIVAAFASPEAMEAMARQGNVIKPTSPEAAAAYFGSEQARYARLAKKANVVLE